jgi:acyl-CoA dehydrogenase family protein 9
MTAATGSGSKGKVESVSFTRGVFAGAVHDALLFPFPAPLARKDPGEAKLLAKLLGRLREMRGTLIDPQAIDEAETVSEEIISAFAAEGFLSLTIPRKYGGLELSSTAYARFFSELSATEASLAVLVGVHCGLGSKAIVLFGNDAQKERYLPPLARGEYLAAYALTEPETGSDAQNIVTRARRSESDDSWVLNGRKIWIGNGHRAGVIATFAQTEVERHGEKILRPTAFLIRPDMPGFEVAGTVRKLGIRGSTQAELVYRDMQVPDDHLLGQQGKGFAVAVHVLNGGRLTLAAGCTGGTKAILKEMATFAEGRVQFGKPIAEYEITQRKLARTAADVYASDCMLGVLASLIDNNEHDFALEAACAKVFSSDMIWRAADEMVQVGGGRGFVKPYPYERLLRDARINRIFEGTNEVLRLFIALNGIQGPAERLKEVGTALREPLLHLGLLSGYARSRLRSAFGASAVLDVELHDELAEHGKYFEKHVAELAAATDKLIRRHKKEIVGRQLELERLADMAIELYATAASLSRTQTLIEERGVEECKRELELCGLVCIESGKRFRAARVAIGAAEDEARLAVAASVRRSKGYFVSDAIMD